MRKLAEFLNNIFNTGKIPKGLTLTDVRLLSAVYNDLCEFESTTIINKAILPILKDCGIKTKKEGIGWRCFI